MNQEDIEKRIKEFRTELGRKIKNVREGKDYSQQKLAEMMKITPTTIAKIESGKFSITVDYLVRFSLILDYEFKVMEK